MDFPSQQSQLSQESKDGGSFTSASVELQGCLLKEYLYERRRSLVRSDSGDSGFSLERRDSVCPFFDAEKFLEELGFAESRTPLIPDRFIPSLIHRLSNFPDEAMTQLDPRVWRSIDRFKSKERALWFSMNSSLECDLCMNSFDGSFSYESCYTPYQCLYPEKGDDGAAIRCQKWLSPAPLNSLSSQKARSKSLVNQSSRESGFVSMVGDGESLTSSMEVDGFPAFLTDVHGSESVPESYSPDTTTNGTSDSNRTGNGAQNKGIAICAASRRNRRTGWVPFDPEIAQGTYVTPEDVKKEPNEQTQFISNGDGNSTFADERLDADSSEVVSDSADSDDDIINDMEPQAEKHRLKKMSTDGQLFIRLSDLERLRTLAANNQILPEPDCDDYIASKAKLEEDSLKDIESFNSSLSSFSNYLKTSSESTSSASVPNSKKRHSLSFDVTCPFTAAERRKLFKMSRAKSQSFLLERDQESEDFHLDGNRTELSSTKTSLEEFRMHCDMKDDPQKRHSSAFEEMPLVDEEDNSEDVPRRLPSNRDDKQHSSNCGNLHDLQQTSFTQDKFSSQRDVSCFHPNAEVQETSSACSKPHCHEQDSQTGHNFRILHDSGFEDASGEVCDEDYDSHGTSRELSDQEQDDLSQDTNAKLLTHEQDKRSQDTLKLQSLEQHNLSQHADVKSLDQDNASQHANVKFLEQDNLSQHADVKFLEQDNLSQHSDVKLLKKDSLSQYADVKSLKQDNVSQHDDVKLLKNDNASQHADVKSLEQDNLSQHADIKLLQQDNISQHADVKLLQRDNLSQQADVKLLEQDNVSQHTNVKLLEHDNVSQHTNVKLLEQDSVSQHAVVKLLEQDNFSQHADVKLIKQDNLSQHTDAKSLEQDNLSQHAGVKLLEQDNVSQHADIKFLEQDVSQHADVKLREQDNLSQHADIKSLEQDNLSQHIDAKSLAHEEDDHFNDRNSKLLSQEQDSDANLHTYEQDIHSNNMSESMVIGRSNICGICHVTITKCPDSIVDSESSDEFFPGDEFFPVTDESLKDSQFSKCNRVQLEGVDAVSTNYDVRLSRDQTDKLVKAASQIFSADKAPFLTYCESFNIPRNAFLANKEHFILDKILKHNLKLSVLDTASKHYMREKCPNDAESFSQVLNTNYPPGLLKTVVLESDVLSGADKARNKELLNRNNSTRVKAIDKGMSDKTNVGDNIRRINESFVPSLSAMFAPKCYAQIVKSAGFDSFWSARNAAAADTRYGSEKVGFDVESSDRRYRSEVRMFINSMDNSESDDDKVYINEVYLEVNESEVENKQRRNNSVEENVPVEKFQPLSVAPPEKIQDLIPKTDNAPTTAENPCGRARKDLEELRIAIQKAKETRLSASRELRLLQVLLQRPDNEEEADRTTVTASESTLKHSTPENISGNTDGGKTCEALTELQKKTAQETSGSKEFWEKEIKKATEEISQECHEKLSVMEAKLRATEEQLSRTVLENERLKMQLEIRSSTLPACKCNVEAPNSDYAHMNGVTHEDLKIPSTTKSSLSTKNFWQEWDRLQCDLTKAESKADELNLLLNQKLIELNKMQLTLSKQTKEMVLLERAYFQLRCHLSKRRGNKTAVSPPVAKTSSPTTGKSDLDTSPKMLDPEIPP